MRKITFSLMAFALVATLTQCRKPHFQFSNESYSQEITFSNDGGNEKGDLYDALTSLKYNWDDDDCLYVYCLDSDKNGLSYAGKLKIVPGSIVGSKASFRGNVNVVGNSEYFRFYHFGDEVELNTSSHTATSNLSSQNGILTGSSTISKKIVTYSDIKINDNGVYGGKMDLLFSLLKLNLTDFGVTTEGDVKASGMKGNRLNVSGTGNLTLDFAGSNETISLNSVTSSSTLYYVAIPYEIPSGSKSTLDTRIKFYNNIRETYIPINTTADHYYTGAEGAAYRFTEFYPKGALAGKFSVANGTQVYFSQGNLQWTYGGEGITHEVVTPGATGYNWGTWRFAENQWDFIGNDNIYFGGGFSHVSGYYMDLFGFATSGYSQVPFAYGASPSVYGNLDNDISKSNYDWGYYNAISNGGNTTKRWRTLSDGEWQYLITGRNNNSTYSSTGKYMAGVGNLTLSNGSTKGGMFLLPDDYYTKYGHKDFTSVRDWAMTEKELEDYNVMFSPGYGGYRDVTTVYGCGDNIGYFQSCTAVGNDNLKYEAYGAGINNGFYLGIVATTVVEGNTVGRRHFGFFVREVRDVNMGVNAQYP